MTSRAPYLEAILAEHASVRSEIQQLNGQMFAVLGSSLALNVAILGWLAAGESPLPPYVLPTVGLVLLLGGNWILLNRNRLAHRLALFQKYFIESRIPDIWWGDVYFAYRERTKKWRGLTRLGERLADSGVFLLLLMSGVNVLVLIALGLAPRFRPGATTIDWLQVGNLVLALVLVGLQALLRRLLTNYEPVESTMRDLATERGLATADERP